MTTALTLTSPRARTVEHLLRAYYSGKSPHTIRAYKDDLEDFAEFINRAFVMPTRMPQGEALRHFLTQGVASAHEILLFYREDLQTRGKAPATVNRRLAAIRSLVKVGKMLGLVPYDIEIKSVRHETSRDTRGPEPGTVADLLGHLAKRGDRIGARNVGMIRLMYDLGLRVGEVCHLDLADLEFDTAKLWVLGKGRTKKELLSVPAPTMEALCAYVRHRGHRPGPLFRSESLRAGRDADRLTTRAAYRIVRRGGAAIGIKLWPHALRHSAVTQAVQQSVALGVSLDEVCQFSRHKNIATLLIYRDTLRNVQGTLADAVAETLAGTSPRQTKDE